MTCTRDNFTFTFTTVFSHTFDLWWMTLWHSTWIYKDLSKTPHTLTKTAFTNPDVNCVSNICEHIVALRCNHQVIIHNDYPNGCDNSQFLTMMSQWALCAVWGMCTDCLMSVSAVRLSNMMLKTKLFAWLPHRAFRCSVWFTATNDHFLRHN